MRIRAHAFKRWRGSLVGAMLTAWTLALPILGAAQPVDGYVRARGVHVAQRPGATLVAVTVVIPVGSLHDPEGAPGTARFLAEIIAHSVRRRTDADPSRLDLRVERGWTAFTLLSTGDAWTRSWVALESAMFRRPLEDVAREEVRTRLLARFAFEEGIPAHEFQRELHRILVGTGHPWNRDPRAMRSTIDAVDSSVLEEFRARHYVAELAVAAVVGPVAEQAAHEALFPVGQDARGAIVPGGDPAWTEGDRLVLEREVTNAWIGVFFPSPLDQRRTLLEFLAFQLQDELNSLPPDPGLYSATVHIEDTPRGPVLVAQAAVVPEASGRWEERILRAMERLGENDNALFRWRRRRFRSASLLREAEPEATALRMALDLVREGRARSLPKEIPEIDAYELTDAVGSLANPRILLMGPDLPTP